MGLGVKFTTKKVHTSPIGGRLVLEIEEVDDGPMEHNSDGVLVRTTIFYTRITTLEGAIVKSGLDQRTFDGAVKVGMRLANTIAANVLQNCYPPDELCPGCRRPLPLCVGGNVGCAKPKPCAEGCPKGGACEEEDC